MISSFGDMRFQECVSKINDKVYYLIAESLEDTVPFVKKAKIPPQKMRELIERYDCLKAPMEVIDDVLSIKEIFEVRGPYLDDEHDILMKETSRVVWKALDVCIVKGEYLRSYRLCFYNLIAAVTEDYLRTIINMQIYTRDVRRELPDDIDFLKISEYLELLDRRNALLVRMYNTGDRISDYALRNAKRLYEEEYAAQESSGSDG